MEAVTLILKSFLLISLGIASIIDIKNHKLPLLLILIMAAGTITFQILLQNHRFIDLAAGFLIGGVLFSISLITKGSIGIADSLIFMITGIGLGLWANVTLLMIALFLSAIVSALLALLKKKSLKAPIAFIPFILCGYIFTIAFY